MRNYELMAVLSPELDTNTHESSLEKIAKLITDNSGNIESIDRWGKKKLSYEIKHLNDGNYSIFYFTGTPDTVKEVDRVLKIDDAVLRFMIVKRIDKDKAKKL